MLALVSTEPANPMSFFHGYQWEPYQFWSKKNTWQSTTWALACLGMGLVPGSSISSLPTTGQLLFFQVSTSSSARRGTVWMSCGTPTGTCMH
jgi:hypothetical protein